MKQFIGSTNNVGIRQTEEGIQPFVEVILLLTEPNYNAGLNGVIKRIKCQTAVFLHLQKA